MFDKLGEGFATSLALQIKNPAMQTLVYTGSQYVILEVSQLMFESLNGFTGANLQALSLAQIKMSIFRKSFNFAKLSQKSKLKLQLLAEMVIIS